jgi:hypothetical protein
MNPHNKIMSGYSLKKYPLPPLKKGGIAKFEPLALIQSTSVELSVYSISFIALQAEKWIYT